MCRIKCAGVCRIKCAGRTHHSGPRPPCLSVCRPTQHPRWRGAKNPCSNNSTQTRRGDSGYRLRLEQAASSNLAGRRVFQITLEQPRGLEGPAEREAQHASFVSRGDVSKRRRRKLSLSASVETYLIRKLLHNILGSRWLGAPAEFLRTRVAPTQLQLDKTNCRSREAYHQHRGKRILEKEFHARTQTKKWACARYGAVCVSVRLRQGTILKQGSKARPHLLHQQTDKLYQHTNSIALALGLTLGQFNPHFSTRLCNDWSLD